ncbi:MAG: M23 family metallopeptidase [Betaproteobacteria bacterium]|nr:M23 family metallopeptidase [Betaproteobacteria bacterium]
MESIRISKSEFKLIAINDSPATITFKTSITGTNIRIGATANSAHVIPPHSRREITRIERDVWNLSYKFHHDYKFWAGDISFSPDRYYLYRLPFANGIQSRISQAPGGTLTTHLQPNSRYAIDFNLPEGTPVVAARTGVVIALENRFTEGRYSQEMLDKANYIEIMHQDRSIALYTHLSPHSNLVKIGQTVPAGKIIGYSGNTGFSGGPHLHFAVTHLIEHRDGSIVRESLPIKFFNHTPPRPVSIIDGSTVTADYP